ncbi:tail fiber domain-containing protein [Stenotrophomonas sp. RG-453]|uniref:tail fiber domain-containing protein n=1 Tax=Stenotrophomonas sp. RG-453 TaxID=2957502 RepID=UPI0029C9B49B|nr:tail fiber domain-containing protein [Stenotrophomonas sp. RG-453]MDX5515103.1 tail fiber domain-containing protein [Stenotrophomonas sp. RG-453]
MSTTPGYVSNSELATRLSTLVDRWNRRENQMIALLTQEEGTVVVTDGLGVNYTLPSFPQLQKDVGTLTNELTGSVVQVRDLVSTATALASASEESAQASAASAEESEASAVRAAASAADIADEAVAAADAATRADQQATAAANSATQAAASAYAASSAAEESAASALAASGSATSAATSSTEAGTARTNAQAAATAAATSRDQAQTILGYVTDTADLAEADATEAAASAAAAAESASDAATAFADATAQANRAEAQASIATTKASEAAGSATTAAGHSSTASGYASAASSSAQSASSAKTAAETARDTANLYANAPQGTEVSPGEFSAKHWAAQAQAAATGSLIYMGSWDASTGEFPANPVKGHFYKVVGEGTVGDIHWRPGDQALYGAAWEKIDNTDQVTSVAGKQGDVSLVAGDIGGLGALATRSDVDFNTHVTGKPTTYPPSTHSHTKAQVGLDKVDNTADLDKPVSAATQAALDGKAAASHTHAIANVTGLQTALDGKAASSHTHTIANVSGLQSALDGKTDVGHTHTVASVSGLQSALDAKLDKSGGTVTNLSAGTFYANTARIQPGAGTDQAFIRQEGSCGVTIDAVNSVNSAYAPLSLRGSVVNVNAPAAVIGSLSAHRVSAFGGTFAVQTGLIGRGWSNGVTRWLDVLEGDGSLAMYAYDSTGANGYNLLSMKTPVTGGLAALGVNGRVSVNGAPIGGDEYGALTVKGGVKSLGNSSCLAVEDRSGGPEWNLYATGSALRLWAAGAGDRFSVQTDGTAAVAGRLNVGNQIYLGAGWFRSQQAGTGWYSDAHGGGIHMQDSTWVRTYNGKGILIASAGGTDGGLRLESTSPTITFYDTDNGTSHWLHCNDNNLGFLASNSFGWSCFRNSGNDWQCQSNIIAYASDARLKENVTAIEQSKVDDFFAKFQVREFDWNDEQIAELNPGFTYSSKHEYGAIAQEVEEVLPYMVHESAHNGIKTILWDKAVPLLIAEVQALRKRLAELEGGA